MIKNLFIFGAGGHAESLLDVINYGHYWQITSFIGKEDDLGKKIGDFEIKLCDNNLDDKFFSEEKYCLIGVGQIGLDLRRYNLFKRIQKYNFIFPKIVSPLAYLSKDSVIGDGTVLFHNSFVNANTQIGSHCIINTKALIEHGCKIGDFCHISTGAIINGQVKIGSGSFIGSGVIIREGINIPENTVISAGKRIMGWPSEK